MPVRWNFLQNKSANVVKPKTAHAKGLDAENMAESFLTKQKFTILARRFKTKNGEIDIIALKENLVIFCEIKGYANRDDALYAITERQQKRITDTASQWLATNPCYAQYDCRFDALLIVDNQIEWLENAWC